MPEKAKKDYSNLKFWLLLWGLGLAGQLCWNVENQWFSNFVYAKIAPWPWVVSVMVALSALATTFSTFFFGTWSDRKGTRKKFLSLGYILWGAFTIVFGLTEFMKVDGNEKSVLVAAIFVIVFDCVMSFFGSMGNDSGFNAWYNDNLNEKNKGGIGAAMATQPVICTILGTVLGGMIVGTDNSNYMLLFLIFGGFVILVGILSIFIMKDAPTLKPVVTDTFWKQFASVFSFKKFFGNKELVWINIATCVYFIGFNCYFSYMGIYMINFLGFGSDMMGYIEGVALVLAMALAIPATFLINKNKSPFLVYASIAATVAGCLILYFGVNANNVNVNSIWNPVLLLGVFLVGAGYVIVTQTSTVWVKELFPKDSHGQCEGIRITFFVLLPMMLGMAVSTPLINKFGQAVTEHYATGDITGMAPNGVIYLSGAILAALAVIPTIIASRYYKKRVALKSLPSPSGDSGEQTGEQK